MDNKNISSSDMDLDLKIERSKKFLYWLIMGCGQHGITPMMFPKLSAEMVESLYNVEF